MDEPSRFGGAKNLQCHFAISKHRSKDVVEFVRDASRQRADGFKPLRMRKSALQDPLILAIAVKIDRAQQRLRRSANLRPLVVRISRPILSTSKHQDSDNT